MKYHWTFGDIFGEFPQRHGVSFLVNNIFTINISTEKSPERLSSDPSDPSLSSDPSLKLSLQ